MAFEALQPQAQGCCGLPLPPIPQEASFTRKRIERESPQLVQEPDWAAPCCFPWGPTLPSTGHPLSGQINSLSPQGRWGPGGGGVGQPCGLKPAKR